MELELHRLAAQEVLQRLAPDLTAQISAILRAYSRTTPTQPPTALDTALTYPDAVSSQPPYPPDTAPTPTQDAVRLHSSSASPAVLPSALDGQVLLTMGLVATNSLAAEDSQQQLLSDVAQLSSTAVPNRRTSRFNQLPTVLSNVPMDQLPFEPLSPNAAPMGEAAEQAQPMSSASVRAQAWQLQQQLLQDMKQGRLVMLSAGETVQQAAHCIVLQGSVKLAGQPLTGATAPGMCRMRLEVQPNKSFKPSCGNLSYRFSVYLPMWCPHYTVQAHFDTSCAS